MIARLRTHDRLRSAIRFMVGLSVADAAAVWAFGTTTDAVMVAFAVIIHLYFLDFDGTKRDRLVGLSWATAVGAAAIVLGVLVAPTTALALGATFVVVVGFSLARVLRGHVARSSVGLTAAFLWPVMLPPTRDRLVSYLVAWLLGCAIATAVAMLVLPRRRSDRVCAALGEWLRAAAAFTRALVGNGALDACSQDLHRSSEQLRQVARRATGSLGGVGRRQRALGAMVARAEWAHPIVAELSPDHCCADAVLATATAAAFEESSALVSSGPVPSTVTDLESARQTQLERLDGETPAQVAESYPLRVTSLAASLELWLAAGFRGRSVCAPVVGGVAEETPRAILRATIRGESVWLRSALMSGVGAVACLALVRGIGIDHGLWVLIAALVSFQGAFSATAGRRRLVWSSLGAAGGVVIAGSLFLIGPPHAVYVALVPITAFAAKYAQPAKMWVSQLCFTPFILVNLVVLGTEPRPALAIIRVEDIALGALVAAILTLLVFPVGIGRRLDELTTRALSLAWSYAHEAIAVAQGATAASTTPRPEVTRAMASMETNLYAGHLATRSPDPELERLDRRHALARECLIAGDTCAFLSGRPGGEVPASAIAQWWEATLAAVRSSTMTA